MKLAVAVLSVIVLTSYVALATNTPHQQGYELNREQAALHGMGKPIALDDRIHGLVNSGSVILLLWPWQKSLVGTLYNT